jgi:hypothetical protein
MTRTHDHSTDARPEHVMLDLGPGVGALVLHTGANLHGAEIEISRAGHDGERSHKQVHERPVAGRPLYGAVFDQLPAGEYTLWLEDKPLLRDVAVGGAAVTDISLKEEHA